MPTIYLDPSANFLPTWNINDYANIRKLTRQPSTPDTSTFIRANDADDNESLIHFYSVASGDLPAGTCTSITLWSYNVRTAFGSNLLVQLGFTGGGSTSLESMVLTTSNAWRSVTWSSLTRDMLTEVAGMFRAYAVNTLAGVNTTTVFASYLEVTYTPAPGFVHCIGPAGSTVPSTPRKLWQLGQY